RQLLEVDVPPRDERDDPLSRGDADLAGEERPGGRGAGGLDVELGPREEEAHPLLDLVLGDGDDVVHGLAGDGEGEGADEGGRHAVGQGRRPGYRNRLAGGERGAETGTALQ